MHARKMGALAVLAVACLAAVASVAHAADTKKPNFVVIFTVSMPSRLGARTGTGTVLVSDAGRLGGLRLVLTCNKPYTACCPGYQTLSDPKSHPVRRSTGNLSFTRHPL